MRKLAAEPYGMLLVTGPTGSGKTTTLYATISEINHGRDKIVTIEDPIEYQLAGVLQIPVNEKKGLTFARGLRSILRHDPDRIMVGEIRDPETAQIAIQAALTGHLVFTTVHANNVFDVLGRFTHMEVDPYSFASALNGVVAQRLVRLNCPHCLEEYTPTSEEAAALRMSHEKLQAYKFKKGRGCLHCRTTGYIGREGIYEVLPMSERVRRLIAAQSASTEIFKTAREEGLRTLKEAAIEKVFRGVTTTTELVRVTGK
jgi:general secretion pathway protein E